MKVLQERDLGPLEETLNNYLERFRLDHAYSPNYKIKEWKGSRLGLKIEGTTKREYLGFGVLYPYLEESAEDDPPPNRNINKAYIYLNERFPSRVKPEVSNFWNEYWKKHLDNLPNVYDSGFFILAKLLVEDRSFNGRMDLYYSRAYDNRNIISKVDELIRLFFEMCDFAHERLEENPRE